MIFSSQNPVKRALLISLVASLASLSLKIAAFVLTSSTAALSDAMESVVHLFAVGFVVYGYYLSLKPADDDHHYGHERIELLSVGAEGAIIIVAGVSIVYHAAMNIFTGIEISNFGPGMALLVAAASINLLVGTYVQRVGRDHQNMIAVSNGKHTLTDVWTSGGVVLALLLIQVTGWVWIDVIVSLLIAAYIIREAWKLLSFSVKGIMDTRNPSADRAIRAELDKELPGSIEGWHHLRHRTSGNTTWVELHLKFKDEVSIQRAHSDATRLERNIIDALDTDGIITMHFEPLHGHDKDHQMLEGANKTKRLDEFA
ncbi:MAG: cation diffusion facilitator family transporter [Cyclonatronaceae bacterium]